MKSLRTRPGIATALVASGSVLKSDCLIQLIDPYVRICPSEKTISSPMFCDSEASK